MATTPEKIIAALREVVDNTIVALDEYAEDIAHLEAERVKLIARIKELEPKPLGMTWGDPVLSVDGCFLFLTATNPDGSVFDFNQYDPFPIFCDLGNGPFQIPVSHIAYDDRDFKRLVAVIPKENRQEIVLTAHVAVDEFGEVSALSVNVKPENLLVEVFEYVEPEPLEEIQACLASGFPRFVGDFIFQDLSRQIGNEWLDRLGPKGVRSEQTSVGLPTNFSGQLICNAISEMGDLPTGRMIMAWKGDTNVTILPHRSNGPNVVDDTIDGDWRILTLEQSQQWDTLWLITSDDCKDVTNFVICYESDWDAENKRTKGTITERFLSYAGRFTTLRPSKEIGSNAGASFVTAEHITPAEFRGYRQVLDATANVVSVELVQESVPYFGNDSSNAILKVTHDSPGKFFTGDVLWNKLSEIPGTLGDLSLSHWKITARNCYVPDPANPVLYLLVGGAGGDVLDYLGGGYIGVRRDYGWAPEQLAMVANELHQRGRLNKLHVGMGHHESVERMREYFRRLYAALDDRIVVILENSNEWVFNWNTPFAPQFWHARFSANLIDGDQWDWGAVRISEIYDAARESFPEDRLEAGIFGQMGNRRATEKMLDSSFLTAPIKMIGATNYFSRPKVVDVFNQEVLESLNPDAWVTGMASCVQRSAEAWAAHAELAVERGLIHQSYEGGNHVTHKLDKYKQEVIFAHWMPRQALPFNLMFQHCKRLGMVPSFFQLISKTPVTAKQSGQWVGVSTPLQVIGMGSNNPQVIDDWYNGIIDGNEFLRRAEAVKMNEVLKWCPKLKEEINVG